MTARAIELVPSLAERYRRVRALSERLIEPLTPEDMVVQTMPDVSPTKWHLAHVTWFFETFVLRPFDAGYQEFDPAFATLFNSYYQTVGPMHPRPERGFLSRPTVDQVLTYRAHVDRAVLALLDRGGDGGDWSEALRRIEIGAMHEEQHQELLLMDIKHVLGTNPLRPAYRDDLPGPDASEMRPLRFVSHPGGIVEVGAREQGFAYDNERPRHEVLLRPFEIADRLVTTGEWLEFVRDGGYRRPDLWLADGWTWLQEERIDSPLYWRLEDDTAFVYTLGGEREIDEATPVVHVSYFEADAFARWKGARLPTEFEWETVTADLPVRGRFLGAGVDVHHPRSALGSDRQWFGDVWEWTSSPYVGYPGFRPLDGSLGEYNGKFMSGQFVLRGGACVTPDGHFRSTYRNFFYPQQRWAFSGLRLARDV